MGNRYYLYWHDMSNNSHCMMPTRGITTLSYTASDSVYMTLDVFAIDSGLIGF